MPAPSSLSGSPKIGCRSTRSGGESDSTRASSRRSSPRSGRAAHSFTRMTRTRSPSPIVSARRTATPFVATRRVDFHLRRPGAWKRARRVIAISRAVSDVLLADGISANRITIIPSGISLEDVRAVAPIGIRGQLGLAAETTIAVNVAALVGHKDHATLLRAADALRDHASRSPLGHCRRGASSSRDRATAGPGFGSRVHILGHIRDPVGLIADADVYVMSSSQEGLGTSVLDAMARGIPVASTAAGGLPELLQDGAVSWYR